MPETKQEQAPKLADLGKRARTDAEQAEARNGSKLISGPYDVGNLGRVAVVEREVGEHSYLYAEFTGTGRAQRVPLAAVAVLAEQMA